MCGCLTVFIPSIVFEFGDVHPFQRGFFCDDNSIKYPYKNNTVPSWAVPLVGFLVTAITVSYSIVLALSQLNVQFIGSPCSLHCESRKDQRYFSFITLRNVGRF